MDRVGLLLLKLLVVETLVVDLQVERVLLVPVPAEDPITLD